MHVQNFTLTLLNPDLRIATFIPNRDGSATGFGRKLSQV